MLLLLVLPMSLTLAAVPVTGEKRCHSEQFTKAKRQLDALVLNNAQRQAIATYEATFWKNWQATHREKGCSHHEAHAAEFISAASGVLTEDQFRKFRGRARTEAERLQNEVWNTGVYIDNLLKIASSL
jgi:hypothetical protein